MNAFNYSCPTKVIFGAGKISSIADLLPDSHKNVLIVSSRTAAVKSGALDKIKDSLGGGETNVFYKNTISPNPRITEVDDLSAYCQSNNITALIAVGGGSVIDAAKAIALAAPSKLPCKTLLSHDLSSIAPLFLIAVPTTAGTGSEVSKGAILSDMESTWKGGIRGDKVFPAVALLDPLLTKSLPWNVTMETGFDIITHAFESLVSKAASPITRMQSIAALETAVPALVSAADGELTLEVRSALMYASLLAGYNLANASTCLPHRLQYPIGANTDSAHARGLAAIYPAWFRSTYAYAPSDFNLIGNLINKSLGIETLVRDEAASTSAIIALLAKLDMSHKLRDFGVEQQQCERFTLEVEGNLGLDPGCTKLETLNKIYVESW
jgi:alcohol dehydrogenase class IV